MAKLAVLGGGKMGEALVGGLVAAGWVPTDVAIAEVAPERRAHLEGRFDGAAVVDDPARAAAGADTVIVAVKPDDVAAALRAAASTIESTALVLSIAAGVRIAALEALVPENPVVRVMPNTPALVGQGVAAIAPGTHATDADLDMAEAVLGAVGIVVRCDEAALDAVTAVSGSGPAYVFYLAEAMIEAGVEAGLPHHMADTLVRQTLVGSAALLAESGETPGELRAAVTSPGGTTAAAMSILEERGVRPALIAAIDAAARRSRELGEQ